MTFYLKLIDAKGVRALRLRDRRQVAQKYSSFLALAVINSANLFV